MKTITMTEEFQIPSTEIILEKGDQIHVLQEDSFDDILRSAPPIVREIGSEIGQKLGWDVNAAEALCLYILQDVNEQNQVLDAVADIFMKNI